MLWPTLPTVLLLTGSILVAGNPIAAPGNCGGFTPCENDALKVIQALKASSFCSAYLCLKPQTVRQTVTATTRTVSVTRTVPATTTVPYTVTKRTTVTNNVVITDNVPGPSLTVTSKPTVTVYKQVTQSFSATVTTTSTVLQYVKNMRRDGNDAVAERSRQLEALGVLEDRDLDGRSNNVQVPDKLIEVAPSILSKVCKCYVTTVTTTIKTTVQATRTAPQTRIKVTTLSRAAGTTVVTVVQTRTRFRTVTLPGVTKTTTIEELATQYSTVSVTATTTVPATVTAYAPGTYTLQFSGNGCVQNEYTHYDLVNEPYSTNERLFQVCAAQCASYGSACKSFFAYQDNEFPYQWCIIDDQPYDPSYRQCSIPFSGANLAYNSPY